MPLFGCTNSPPAAGLISAFGKKRGAFLFSTFLDGVRVKGVRKAVENSVETV